MNSKSSFAILASFAFVLATPVFAATKTAEIRQIDTRKHLAVVQTHGSSIRVGDSLIATAKDSTQCSLPVRSLKNGRATVDTSGCGFASQLRVGQTLETSMLEDSTTRETSLNQPASNSTTNSSASNSTSINKFAEVAGPGETIGVTIFGFYDMADKFRGDVNLAGQTDGLTENSESAFGIGAEYAMYNYHFVGFYADGAYEFGRDWKSTEYRGTTTAESSKPSLTLFLVGGGANFLITDNFYAKAGLNYNFPSLSNGGIVSDISGKLGFETGVGARFARNFNAELIYRRINMTASGKTQGESFTFDNVNASGLVLRGGYTF